MNKHKYIFIGGLHRSGTWLLSRCLNEHPLISRLAGSNEKGTEGQFLQTVYPSDQYFGGVGKFGFHPDAHFTEKSPLVTEDNRAKLYAEWGRYWDTSKPFLLEKTPANLIRSRFFQAMFPDSYFIFIMRHPVAVTLAEQKWTGLSVASLMEHWLVCYETLLADKKYLNNSIIVKYEDIIENPQAIFNKVYQFLEIQPTSSTQEVRKNGNDLYLQIWERALSGNHNSRSLFHRAMKNLMPYAIKAGYPVTILANQVEDIILKYEHRVNVFGYSLRNLAEHNEIYTPVSANIGQQP